MQGQALLDYIKRVNDLEAEIYANHQILSQFSQAASKKSPPKPAEPKYIAIQEPVPPPKPTAVKETEFSKTAIAKAMIILLLLGVVLFAVGMFLSLEYRYEEIAKNLIIFGAFLLGMGAFINLATKAERSGDPGAFNDCIIFTIPQIIDMYNAEYRSYEKRLADYEKNRDLWISQNEERKNAYANELNAYNVALTEYKQEQYIEKSKIESAEYALQAALQQLYDINVIFPKYRNLVAISMIYEYLSSGRCDRLDGPDGAYNLYEIELRQNIIIGQLSSIVENLNQIRNNQFTLYNEIVSANQRVASVLSDIGNNVKISAYQNEAAAKNAEALKYISLIKR